MKINILNGYYYSIYFSFVMTLIHSYLYGIFSFVYVLQLMNKHIDNVKCQFRNYFSVFYTEFFCQSNIIDIHMYS